MRKLYEKEERICGDEMMKLIEQCGIHEENDFNVMYYAIVEDEERILVASYGSDTFLLLDLVIIDAVKIINDVGRKLATEGFILAESYVLHPEIQIFRMMKGDRDCLIKVDDFDIRLKLKEIPALTWLKFEARCPLFEEGDVTKMSKWERISKRGYPIAVPVKDMTELEIVARIKELEKQHPGLEFHYDDEEKAILGKLSDELKKRKEEEDYTGVK